jgi:hypothetical protein
MRGGLALLSGRAGRPAVRIPWSPARVAEDMRGAAEPNGAASTVGDVL